MDPDATLPPPEPGLSYQPTLGYEAGEPPRVPPVATGLADGGDDHPEVPGYEVQKELGRGGMGVVYLARQVNLNRSVALKLLPDDRRFGAVARQRFQSEAESAAKVSHPGIVQVFEIGSHDGRPYFALEFCPGGSLADKLKGTPLPPRQAAELVETVSQAVQAAHDAGVIHRDLKPDNVLFSLGGTPKVADFGLAKPVEADSSLTTDGAVLGTPSYMAPEQARGDGKAVGPRADVYSLGAVLYECLTGRPPFRAATLLETLAQVMEDEPVAPRKLVRGLPKDVETVCLKCLAKEPGKRYPSAAALADDLRRFLDGRPIVARPVSTVERAWKAFRRRPEIGAVIGSVAGCLLAVFAILGMSNARLAKERNLAVVARNEAETARRDAETAKDRADAERRKADDRLAAAVEAIESMVGHTSGETWAMMPQLQEERRKLLEDAVTFYERLAATDGNDPVVKRESARANVRAGRAWLNLGDNARSETACRKAVALHADLLAARPDDPAEAATAAEAHSYLGHTLAVGGNYPGALTEYTTAQRLAEKAVAGNPADTEAVATLIRARGNLANFYSVSNQARALAEATAAAELGAKLVAAPDPPAAHRLAYSAALVQVGNVHLAAGRFAEAGKQFDEAEKVFAAIGGPAKGLGKGPRGVRRPTGELNEQLFAVKGQIDAQRGAVRFASAKGPADLQAALRLFQAGLATFDLLLRAHPKSFPFRVMKYQTLGAVAETQHRLKDITARDKATAELDKLAAEIIADTPAATWVLAGSAIRKTHDLIAEVRNGKHERFDAAATGLLKLADSLPPQNGIGPLVRYNVSCGYAQMAKLGPEADRERHGAAAVTLLAKLAETPYFRNPQRAKELATDPDLDPLRDRDDFKAVRAKVGTAGGPPAPPAKMGLPAEAP